MARTLYRWSDKWYDQEYWGRLERNWRRWKGKKPVRRGMMKMIPEEKEIKEGEDEIGDMVDPYYEL